MNRKEIIAMLKDVIGEVDYDISKYFDPETSEDPEAADRKMTQLVVIVRKHLASSKAKP